MLVNRVASQKPLSTAATAVATSLSASLKKASNSVLGILTAPTFIQANKEASDVMWEVMIAPLSAMAAAILSTQTVQVRTFGYVTGRGGSNCNR